MSPTAPNELGQTLQRFVDWARTMGWRYYMAPFHLAHFRRFLEHHGVHRFDDVDTALVIAYQQRLSATRSPATVNAYLSTLRALWRYLQREGLVARDVTKGATRLRPHHFVPHLYSAWELSCIDRAAQAKAVQASTAGHRFAWQTRRAALGLIRDCGLRVSEACRLNLKHYDPRARSLRIELTKFFKTRVIPLPRSTCALLDRYLKHRRAWVPQTSQTTTESLALFISMYGQRLQRGRLETPFKHLLGELGLYQPRRREGHTVFGSTNLHALRHYVPFLTMSGNARVFAEVTGNCRSNREEPQPITRHSFLGATDC